MSDPTPPTVDNGSPPDSQLFGVSLRGWILVLVLLAMCLIEIARFGVLCWVAINSTDAQTSEALASAAIREPMYSVILLCVGAYFGKQQKSA
jgi:hypothetical protein